MNKILIDEALKLSPVFVDTRSPKEFFVDHIPGSVNIPIFSDDERREVGILYKKSQDDAFDLGKDYYESKMPRLVASFNELDKEKPIVIYCWRGGLRSETITKLVSDLGFVCFQLEGGYKSYRGFVINSLNQDWDFRFVVLWGNTCIGKSKIIEKLSCKLDLEDLAQHRSSLFGGVGLVPRSQKFFESLLLVELNKFKNNKFVFVEGESRKVGDVILPEKVFHKLMSGFNVQVSASINSRIKITISEYLKPEYLDAIKIIVPKLTKKLGKVKVDKLLSLLDQNNLAEFSKILLVDYYDPLYSHSMRDVKYDFSVSSDDIIKCVDELESLLKSLNSSL